DRHVQVEEAVLLEARVERDAEQPALFGRVDRDGRYDLRPGGVAVLPRRQCADEAQPPGALGDERIASLHERDPPGHFESLGHGLEAHLRLSFRAEAFLDQLAFGPARTRGSYDDQQREHPAHACDYSDALPVACSPPPCSAGGRGADFPRRRMQPFEHTPPEARELLKKPIRELGLKLDGSAVERYVQQLYRELEAKGLERFRPACYLSDEWACPDREPIIGIPFYLADPKLQALERSLNDLE